MITIYLNRTSIFCFSIPPSYVSFTLHLYINTCILFKDMVSEKKGLEEAEGGKSER
jgi:hypothetical protein